MRIRLEAEKKMVCESFPGKSCSDKKTSQKLLDKYPCSLVKARIVAMNACRAARQQAQPIDLGNREAGFAGRVAQGARQFFGISHRASPCAICAGLANASMPR